ncbi:MAG: right-handed parallel beta-helix repeat-containing protein [Phycisphaerae bacterium]|nr:right-handed parallel beta-helix repeat-containing protein [Phycisphaerae bacterium]
MQYSRRRKSLFRNRAQLALLPLAMFILSNPLVTATQPNSPEKPATNDRDGSARRIRGLIHQDQTWSGRILIIGDTQIIGAVVDIEPGTEILFAGAEPGHNPVLTVGSAEEKHGSIRLAPDEARPVYFGVAEHAQPGAIIVYLPPPPPNDSAAGSRFRWRGVRFTGVGFERADRKGATKTASQRVPAITVNCAENGTTVELDDCRFTDGSGVLIRAGADSRIKITDCELAAVDATSLTISRTARPDFAGKIDIRDNNLNSGIMLDGVNGEIVGNTIAGDSASLLITSRIGTGSRIEDNLLNRRCAATPGTYALSVNSPASTITNNIIIGAETCVLAGPRTMMGNIIMAQPPAAHSFDQPRSRKLVASLPQGARFEKNYLIGPTGAMLAPWPMRSPGADSEPERRRTTIKNNVFDGAGNTAWAVELDAAGRPVPIAIENNLFMRLENIVINKSGGPIDDFTAGFNAFYPPPRRKYDRFDPAETEPGNGDHAFKSIMDLGLANRTESDDREFRANELARQAKLLQDNDRAGFRRHIVERYRPGKNSPLMGAGRPGSGSANIGPG